VEWKGEGKGKVEGR